MLAKRIALGSVLWSSMVMGQSLKTVAQDNSLAKYAIGDETQPGICREIAAAVTAIDPTLTFSGLDLQTPLTRIEKMLEQGSIDLFFCLLRNKKREAKFNYIDIPLYSVRHILLVKADDPIVIKEYADIRQLGDQGLVLVNFGSALVHDLNDAGVKNIASAKNDLQLIRMLDSGRGRFIYGQDLTIMEMLRRMKLKDRYRILPVTLKEENQYLAYRRGLSQDVVDKLEKLIRSLADSGKLQAIVSRYH